MVAVVWVKVIMLMVLLSFMCGSVLHIWKLQLKGINGDGKMGYNTVFDGIT